MNYQGIVRVLGILGISNSKIVVAVLKWSIKQVGEWARDVVGVDKKYAALLAKQEIDGEALASMTREEFKSYGIPGGPAAELFEGVKKLFPERFGAAPTGLAPRSEMLGPLAKPPPIVSLWRPFLKDRPSCEVSEVIESSDLGVFMNTTTLFIRPCYSI